MPVSSHKDLRKPEVLYAHAYGLYQQGHFEHARDLFQLLTVMDVNNFSYWMGFAACFQLLKQYEKAIQAYGVAAVLETSERNPLPYFHSAECYFALGNQKQALVGLKHAKDIASKQDEYQTFIEQLDLIQTQWSKGAS